MATSCPAAGEPTAILNALRSPSWPAVVDAITAAGAWLSHIPAGDSRIRAVVDVLAQLTSHPKWEVRLSLARAAESGRSDAFDLILLLLAQDVNDRVRSAAESAAVSRKDRRLASVLDKQHAERVVAILNSVERRHGIAVRKAAQRAAEDVGNTYARELYHEVVKLVTPLAVSINRIRVGVSSVSSSEVSRELDRIEGDIRRIEAVLRAMREFATVPRLSFAPEVIRDVLLEATEIARSQGNVLPPVEIEAPAHVVAQVARPRLVQALGNLLSNALESYEHGRPHDPVRATALLMDGYVLIEINDWGAGMSAEGVEQAKMLFASTKPNGTGFGLPLAIRVIESEHNGHLSIASTVGVGTSVKIMLPVRQRDLT